MLNTIAGSGLISSAALLCVGASIAFRHLHHPDEGRQLLLLPASPCEKFMARWMLYVPVLYVLLTVAFMVGDVLRMPIRPLFGYDVSFPSAIPTFFAQMKHLFFITPVDRPLVNIGLWTFFGLFHALSLFCSVWLRRMAWLLVAVVFLTVTGLILNDTGKATELHLWVSVVLTVVLTAGAYWLFCHYPAYQLFHPKKD